MKFEDISVDYNKPAADADSWDVETWRREHPVNYFEIMRLIMDQAKDDLHQLALFQLVLQATRYYLPDTLYKYYSLTEDVDLNNKKLSDLRNNKIYAATPKELNDPFDGKAFFYNPDELKSIGTLDSAGGKLIDDFSSFSRTVSLTANGIQSMPMWAHYAANHKGFAVAYSLEDESNLDLIGNTFPVQYTDERMDITSFMKEYARGLFDEVERQSNAGRREICLNDSSIIYLQLLFGNIKHTSWNYENEFRCTIASNAPKAPYVSAKPKAIFVGMNCYEEHASELKDIADSKNIPIHKMEFDDLDIKYKLLEKKI